MPMDLTMSAARTEFEQIAFSAVKDLLNKTGAQSSRVGRRPASGLTAAAALFEIEG